VGKKRLIHHAQAMQRFEPNWHSFSVFSLNSVKVRGSNEAFTLSTLNH
jgi:hypothetical protein